MDIILLAGRILFASLFLGSAMGHLMKTADMAQYAGSRGVPMPTLATRVTGVQMLLGGLMVVLGLWGDLGAILLFAFLVPTAVLMHAFWKETEPIGQADGDGPLQQGRRPRRRRPRMVLGVLPGCRVDADRAPVLTGSSSLHR